MNSPGHSLGGINAEGLSRDEMRSRRLAALETSGLAAADSNSVCPPPALHPTAERISSNDMEEDSEDDALQAALAMSMQKDNDEPISPSLQNENGTDAPIEAWNFSEPLDIAEFHSIMWDSFMTTDNDRNRWVGQGIDTRDTRMSDVNKSAKMSNRLDHLGASHIPWGLTQAHGGPCGVLAAIQAELLRILLFGTREPLDYPTVVEDNLALDHEISKDLIRNGLALSLAMILARTALTPPATEDYNNKGENTSVKVVVPGKASPDGLCWGDLEPWSIPSDAPKSTTLKVYNIEFEAPESYNPKRQRKDGEELSNGQRICQLAHRVARFLLSTSNDAQAAPLDSFRKPGGVLLLVMSMVYSRGAKLIQSEFDDPEGTKLTSQFGHCGQELMNLLLTGQAVSNVFDNTMKPSGDLTCRGIQSRPMIGYLTQLEALRYCESGGYYKSPHFPIWVVGSTSHFTVLFGDAACLAESKSDELLEKCRRAFKAVDNDENGFISRVDLGPVLHTVGVEISDHEIQTLAATLEVSGADIVLWDSFWKATSRLLTGASLESVLQGGEYVLEEMPPLFRIDHVGECRKVEQAPTMKESDEEMAKRLAGEWGDIGVASAAVLPASASNPSKALSDEELARRLQAEWDAEISGSGSVGAVSGSPSIHELDLNDDDVTQNALADDLTAATVEEDSKMPGDRFDFEKFGDSFPLYHYNGLRGGTLTPFRVTRMSAEEAVGASIALGASSSGGGGDLEDVVRTKWPSCMVNWLGKSPPFID